MTIKAWFTQKWVNTVNSNAFHEKWSGEGAQARIRDLVVTFSLCDTEIVIFFSCLNGCWRCHCVAMGFTSHSLFNVVNICYYFFLYCLPQLPSYFRKSVFCFPNKLHCLGSVLFLLSCQALYSVVFAHSF